MTKNETKFFGLGVGTSMAVVVGWLIWRMSVEWQ